MHERNSWFFAWLPSLAIIRASFREVWALQVHQVPNWGRGGKGALALTNATKCHLYPPDLVLEQFSVTRLSFFSRKIPNGDETEEELCLGAGAARLKPR